LVVNILRRLSAFAAVLGVAAFCAPATAGAATTAQAGVVQPAASPMPGWICSGNGNTYYLELKNKDNRYEKFWVGTDHALWHSWQVSVNGGWSADNSLGGDLTSCIDGNYNQDGRLEIFGRALGNDLDHIWQVVANGGWSGWSSLGGVLAGGPLTWIRANGGIEVEVLGVDNLLHFKWQQQPNGDWTPDWH